MTLKCDPRSASCSKPECGTKFLAGNHKIITFLAINNSNLDIFTPNLPHTEYICYATVANGATGRAGGKASIKKLMMKIFYIEILIHFTFMYRDKCFF